jgi:hypothetical protein
MIFTSVRIYSIYNVRKDSFSVNHRSSFTVHTQYTYLIQSHLIRSYNLLFSSLLSLTVFINYSSTIYTIACDSVPPLLTLAGSAPHAHSHLLFAAPYHAALLTTHYRLATQPPSALHPGSRAHVNHVPLLTCDLPTLLSCWHRLESL